MMKNTCSILYVWIFLLCELNSQIIHANNDISNPTLNAFKKAAEVKWGADNVDLPVSCIWVEYNQELNERFVVCFKSGHVKLQMLLGKSIDTDSEIVMKHVRQGIRNLILSSGNDSFNSFEKNKYSSSTYTIKKGDNLWSISKKLNIPNGAIAKVNNINPDEVLKIGQTINLPRKQYPVIENSNLSKKNPVLLNQLKLKNGRIVTKKNVDIFVDEVIADNKNKPKLIVGTDGTVRKELTFEFNLIEDHLRQRAKLYQPLVKQYADKFNLDEAMLMALIQTESSFNPRARSATPAFGLMQVVPKTAGRDATKFLFGAERSLNSTYLYNPEKNIETGSAYLHILATRYWGNIKNPRSRQYCIITSYNGGAANVSRVFSGTKSRDNAIRIINNMSANEVYRKLKKKHKLRETRIYLQRVTERTPLYATQY
jgi:LysM repeat protein